MSLFHTARVPLVILMLLLIGVFGSLQLASGQRPPAPPPPGINPPSPPPVPQLARVQADFFALTCTGDRFADLNMDKLAAGDATPVDILKRLKEYGNARLLVRLDTLGDLASSLNMTVGNRVPTIQDVIASKDGKATPSITYQEVGAALTCSGKWSDQQPMRGSFRSRIDLSNITRGSVQVKEGLKLPMFQQVKFEHNLLVESGRPLLLMGSQVPPLSDQPAEHEVIILRFTATRMGPAQSIEQ